MDIGRARLAGALVALSCLVASAHANAQAPPQAAEARRAPPATVDPLIVTAPVKPTAKELDRLASAFTRALSEPGRSGQLSRWMTTPCPRVLGLPGDLNAIVEARIRRIASEVGAPGSPPCGANNLFVLATDQPQKLVDAIQRQRPRMLGFHYAAQTKRLTTFKGPVQAWYVTATGRRDESTAVIDEASIQMPGGSAGSRLSAGITSRFEAVLIVVDAARVPDQSIDRLADAIAMLGLARAPMTDGCRDLATILDALEDCESSVGLNGLSAADHAYLVGLYGSNPELSPSLQKSAVRASVRRDLDRD
ncbi:MAG: hypothetical protein ABW360_08405 [Phenylobacterium sp.]